MRKGVGETDNRGLREANMIASRAKNTEPGVPPASKDVGGKRERSLYGRSCGGGQDTMMQKNHIGG